MFYNVAMDTIGKLQELAAQMHLEPAEETGISRGFPLIPSGASCPQAQVPPLTQDKKASLGIFDAQISGGKSIPLLKSMITSACERNCYYCPFRAGRNFRRTTVTPDEMAKSFVDLYRAGMVKGLFLSSGIIGGGVRSQDKLLDAADILRRKYQFRGYIHLKIMPGAEKAQVARAMQLCDRLSVNLEAPNDRRLAQLAPLKQFVTELLQPLRWIEEIRQNQPEHLGWNGRWPSTTTQFVVGGVGETDLELLTTSVYLYRQLNLRRTYFSAFSPVEDTPMEGFPAEDPRRQHRLYQASFLFRDYGYDLEEMPFTQAGNLPLEIDPKLAWAIENLSHAPVELNRASRQELLRVPGVGPKSAYAIAAARRLGTLREVKDLKAVGVRTAQLQPFVLLDGKRPTYQPMLFKINQLG